MEKQDEWTNETKFEDVKDLSQLRSLASASEPSGVTVAVIIVDFDVVSVKFFIFVVKSWSENNWNLTELAKGYKPRKNPKIPKNA